MEERHALSQDPDQSPARKKAERNVLKYASALVARELGKPEEFVMIAVQPDTPMLFARTDDPVAFLELKSIGLPAKKTKRLSETLCALINDISASGRSGSM